MLMWEDVDSIWRVKLLRAFLDRTIWEILVGTRPNLLVNVVFYWMMKPIIEHSLGLYIGILFDLSLQGLKHEPSMGNPSGFNFGLDGPKPNHRLIHSNPSNNFFFFYFFFFCSKAWKLERLELPRYVPTYLVGPRKLLRGSDCSVLRGHDHAQLSHLFVSCAGNYDCNFWRLRSLLRQLSSNELLETPW